MEDEETIMEVEESLEVADTLDDIETSQDESVILSQEEQEALDAAIATQNSEIPVNSPTLQIDESTSRFSSAIWYEAIRNKKILLAGLGGIGSYVAFLLARMHPVRIILYDDDIVEAANMSGQFYSNSNIGQLKAEAIYNTMRSYSSFFNGNVNTIKYSESCIATDIMICGFDNMAARKIFYTNWKQHVNSTGVDKSKCLYIDGRLSAEEFQVLAIQGDDERAMKLYEDNWLFSDEESEATLCSYKQTTFMANMIGSIMVNIFVNFVANECDPIYPRDVPFLTTYTADNMYFKVEM